MKIKSNLTKQVFVFSLLFVVAACGILPKSPKKDMKLNYVFYKPFVSLEKNRLIVKTHWRQYFTTDIINDLSNLDSTKDYHPIFLDNYGVVYPEETIYKDDFNFRENNEVNILDNGSHFKVFNENSKLRNIIMKKGFDSTKYEYKYWEDSLTNDYIKTTHFNQAWNNTFLPEVFESLKEKLKNKKKLVFFIHGYNVPYSLAVMQMLALRQEMKYSGLDVNSTLFVPIFWPSNNMKNSSFSSLKKFNVSDFMGVANLNGFLTYSNQAYFASLTFRKILIELESVFKENNMEVMIVSHSLGATVATSALIKTNSKIWYNDKCNFIKNNIYNIDLKRRFNDEKLPTFPMKLFMSAPAIPGYSTFIDIDSTFSNKVVYSTFNKSDRMVSKFHFLPSKLSSTTLGGNYKNEAGKVRQFFVNKENLGKFYYKEVSKRQDHDIFTYLRQPEYCAFLKEFINHKIEQK